MYKLKGKGVIKDGNLYIPNSPGNRDWREYQEWLSQGNTPLPADPDPVLSNKEKRRQHQDWPDLQEFMEAVLDGNPAALNQMKSVFANIKSQHP